MNREESVAKILLLISLVTISFLAGCGGGGTNVQNAPPPPPANSISIAFQPTPIGSVSVNTSTTLTAVVSNDSANGGVDWALTCQSAGNCGSLSSLHSNSGQAVTYTSPSTPSSNSPIVKIVAFAATDHTKNVIAPITVTGAAPGGLKGTFVLQTSGVDASGQYQFAGVIVLDGNGGITSGEQTINYIDPNFGAPLSAFDPITGGSYSIGPDGRGTLTINTANQNIGQLGIETFYVVLLSSSHGLITKVDDPTAPISANQTASGTMDLQTSIAAPISGYAFVASGIDNSFSQIALGGVFNIDSPKTISGAGSVADQNAGGLIFPSAALSGTVSDPDAFGMVKFDLTTDFAFAPVQFTGYIVDNLHIKLIESDNNTPGAGFGSTSGVAISQGTTTGTFTNQSFSGTHVFGILGTDLNSGLASSLASVGTFTADGAGSLTSGYNDQFLFGLFFQISDQFTGTYLVETTGRVDTGSINFVNNGPGPEFIFYLTGNGNPALMLDFDSTFFALGAGVAYPAAPNSTFAGEYGISFTQNNGSENDATGQISVDGTAQTLSGIVDTNFVLTPVPATPITGNFVTTNVPGRLTATLSNPLFPSDLAVAYYLIDSDHAFFIETDSDITGNLTFGYSARRISIP